MQKDERYKRTMEMAADLTILTRTLRIKRKKLRLMLKRLAPQDVKAIQYQKEIRTCHISSDWEDIKAVMVLNDEIDELETLIEIEKQALDEVTVKLDSFAYQFNDKEQLIFNMFYIDHKPSKEIWETLHIQSNTYYKYKSNINKQLNSEEIER